MSNEELVLKIQGGIDVADNMLLLWQQNQGLIGRVARLYSRYEDMEDLKQQGYIGLCNAVEGYRREEGTLFSTYAVFWIRQSMRRYIENCGSVLRIPVHARNSVMKYRKGSAAFRMECGREPDIEEIRLIMGGISRKQAEQLKRDSLALDTGSLDMPIGEDSETTFLDTLESHTDMEAEIVEEFYLEQLKAEIWPIVDSLPEEQGEVLHRRFQGGETLNEVGEAIGVNRERVRQIESKAMRNLRSSGYRIQLQSLLPDQLESMAYRSGLNSFRYTWTSSTERTAFQLLEGTKPLEATDRQQAIS